ncbi:MAG: helix-turn-helix transcriptional regulator [Bacteroidia bacterium]|nr:helix-turn-helix transcriptional regulator [Bacteroidia bacterium]
MLKILPQLFYQSPDVKKVLVDGLSCIIHKRISRQVVHKEGYVSTHAITMVLKGHLRAENDNGLLTVVKEGQMIFLPKGLYSISDIIPDDDAFEAVVFFFTEDIITEFINSIQLKCNRQKCVSHLLMDVTEPIKEFTRSLLSLYGDGSANRHITRMKLLEFLHLMSKATPTDCFLGALATLNNKERRSLRAFMEVNFSKPLGIADYAYLTGRSLSSFRRDFISQFGISPKQWLIDKRLAKARELLVNNQIHISDVAAEVGYEDVSHFIKAFHKRFGIAPKQYLMQMRKAVLV